MLRAIVLGLVQGLTEFLPVSSSGHLVIVPYLMSWEQPALAFDIALHLGTLLAVLAYFAGDVWWLATRMFGIGTDESDDVARARSTVALLLVGSIPAGIAGLTLESLFESTFGEPRLVSGFLVLTGALLAGAEWIRRRRAAAALDKPVGELAGDEIVYDPGRSEATTGLVDAIVIGLAQGLAIFPGISRSGSTIAAGMVRGLSRQGAARFSFLLSIPAIAGAGLVKVEDLLAAETTAGIGPVETMVGVLVAAVSGYWAIRFLLRLVAETDLLGFARYVSLLGVLTFATTFWLGPATVG